MKETNIQYTQTGMASAAISATGTALRIHLVTLPGR